MLAFGDGKKRGPFGKVLEIEMEVVVFGERIEVGEVHLEEVHRTECAEGCHGGQRRARCPEIELRVYGAVTRAVYC